MIRVFKFPEGEKFSLKPHTVYSVYGRGIRRELFDHPTFQEFLKLPSAEKPFWHCWWDIKQNRVILVSGLKFMDGMAIYNYVHEYGYYPNDMLDVLRI